MFLKFNPKDLYKGLECEFFELRLPKILKFSFVSKNLIFIFLAQKFEGSILCGNKLPDYKFPPDFFQKCRNKKLMKIRVFSYDVEMLFLA